MEECDHSSWGVTSCDHFEDIGIVCLGERLGQDQADVADPRPPLPAACKYVFISQHTGNYALPESSFEHQHLSEIAIFTM